MSYKYNSVKVPSRHVGGLSGGINDGLAETEI